MCDWFLNALLEHVCGLRIQKIGETDVLLDNKYGIPKSLLRYA